MIDPRTVGVFIPTYDHKIQCEMAGFLVACANRFFSQISFTPGVSSPSLARIMIAEKFMQSDLEWAVCIDADMIASPQDFAILMAPQSDEMVNATVPTRVKAKGLAVQNFHVDRTPIEIDADAIVTCEYSYKSDDLRPCRYGLGFTRIHRSVFESIAALKHDDGSSRTWQCLYQGRLMTDYFPMGPFISQVVPQGEWKGEDIGFFTLASLAGIVPRVETRTKLWHVGTKAYPYLGGDVSGAN